MYLKIRPGNGEQIGKRAQVSLELALAFISIFLLLFGTLNLFFWMNERLVLRQRDYEETRVKAGAHHAGIRVDESNYPKLNIFGK